MSSITLDENLLFVINEKFVDFADLKDKGFDLRKIIRKQKLNVYFDILHGSIYINLIKDLWLNTSVGPSGHDAKSIESYINDSLIAITLQLIDKTINGFPSDFGICLSRLRVEHDCLNPLQDWEEESNVPPSPMVWRSWSFIPVRCRRFRDDNMNLSRRGFLHRIAFRICVIQTFFKAK
ncbi:hypothetical protein KIW84_076973 [Lathyrus oleraceus]|uniref:Uncharacterized protein n=1 Tax=Pisum sativum TaxID=3888 RepID=A0A9D4VZM7_PEA|nr:hypothetical protein KIW84_076973 [Pisum sativum]